MSNALVTDQLNVSTVSPCCCCTPSHEQFFKVYSIVLFVLLGLQLASECVNFGLSETGILSFIVSLLISGLMMGFGVAGYLQYKKDGNFGNSYSYCFALTDYIFSWIMAVLLVLSDVYLIAVGTKGLMEIMDSSNSDLDPTHLFVGALVYLNVIMLPLVLYILYLSYLYFKVISAKKSEMKGESELKEEIAA